MKKLPTSRRRTTPIINTLINELQNHTKHFFSLLCSQATNLINTLIVAIKGPAKKKPIYQTSDVAQWVNTNQVKLIAQIVAEAIHNKDTANLYQFVTLGINPFLQIPLSQQYVFLHPVVIVTILWAYLFSSGDKRISIVPASRVSYQKTHEYGYKFSGIQPNVNGVVFENTPQSALLMKKLPIATLCMSDYRQLNDEYYLQALTTLYKIEYRAQTAFLSAGQVPLIRPELKLLNTLLEEIELLAFECEPSPTKLPPHERLAALANHFQQRPDPTILVCIKHLRDWKTLDILMHTFSADHKLAKLISILKQTFHFTTQHMPFVQQAYLNINRIFNTLTKSPASSNQAPQIYEPLVDLITLMDKHPLQYPTPKNIFSVFAYHNKNVVIAFQKSYGALLATHCNNQPTLSETFKQFTEDKVLEKNADKLHKFFDTLSQIASATRITSTPPSFKASH